MIVDYQKKYKNLRKSVKGGKYDVNFKKKVDDFRSEAENTLFDVLACKCKSFSECTYDQQRKVLQKEQIFVTDQRKERWLLEE